MITVISTGWNATTKHLCLASVAAQVGVVVEHRYIEASEQAIPLGAGQNLARACDDLPPDRIVAWVDGDDWLAHRRALVSVQSAHDAGAWVTWGQFMTSDNEPGFASDYGVQDEPRACSWRATHLKSVRAGLVQRIRADDLQWPDGAPWDMAIMFPVLEMAGPGRRRFLSDVLYIYHEPSSYEREHGANRTRMLEQKLRALPRYDRVESI